MDRFRRLAQLLSAYNPFGVVADGKYVSYPTTKDAYVDIMMRISNFAPQGYIDVPLVQVVFQDSRLVKAVERCRRRPELVHINMNEATEEQMNAWMDLLKRLLEYTGVKFDVNKFYAAWAEYVQLKLKQKALSDDSNYQFEHYYESEKQENDDTPEGDQEL